MDLSFENGFSLYKALDILLNEDTEGEIFIEPPNPHVDTYVDSAVEDGSVMDEENLNMINGSYDDGVVCFGPVTESELERHARLPRHAVVPSDIYLRMDEENPYMINGSYDDGIVCFGPVTESELERHARLPRHTVVPSDIHLSQSFLDTNADENNVNISMSTNNLEEEKQTSSIDTKQSFSNDSSSVFSSPCVTEFIKSENLIATEVINRYIRMGSTSPNNEMSSCDQLSVSNISEQNVNINHVNFSQPFLDTNEDKNNVNISMSTNNLEEEKQTSSIDTKQSFSNDSPYETICSDLDPENKNKSAFNDNEMSSCDQLSVSNIFEQNVNINRENIPNVATNICTLKYCSQQDKDASICSDSDLEDDCEGSIITEEYSVTPGKKRLFDLRFAKSSIVPALVMDRIEETTTPILPKDQDSSLKLNHKVSYGTSEIEENMFVLENTNNLIHSLSTVEFNQTVDSCDLESTKYIDDNEKTIDLMVSEVNLDLPLKIVNETLSTSDATENHLYVENSMNVMSITTVSATDVNDYNEDKSLTMEVDNISSNMCVVKDLSDDNKTCIDKLSKNDRSMNFSESLNKTNEDFLNAMEHNFDMEMSTNITSNTTAPVIDINDYNNGEKSVRMEVEIKQTNTSVVEDVSYETNTNNLSTDSLSVEFNKSLNTNNQSGNVLNITEHRLNLENSLNNMTVLTVLPLFSNDTLQSNGIDNDGSKNSAYTDIANSETCNISLKDHQSLSCDSTELNTSNDHLKEINGSLLNNLITASNLSIIIENRTLEENEFDQDFKNSVMSTTSVTENIVYGSQDNEMFNKSTNENERKLSNITKDTSNSDVVEHSTMEGVDNKISEMEIKLMNDVTLINNNIVDSKLLLAENNDTIPNLTSDEKMNEIQHIESCSMLPDKISNISIKVGNYQLGIKTPDQTLISENAKEIHLSQHILDKNNSTNTHHFRANKYILETKNPYENSIDEKQHDVLPTNNIQQHHLLEMTKTLNNSIYEYNQLEQIRDIEEDKKVQMFVYKTPKTEKLLDLTILEQKPTFEYQPKNQKLLNFSLVDETLITKNIKQNDTSIDLNSVDRMWDLEEVLTDKTNFKENGLFLNDVSAISSLDVDLLADESIKTCLSNHNNSICNETITETNFNLSTNCEINMLNITNKDKNTIEKINDVCLLDSCSTVLVNKQIEMKKSSNSLNKTIDQTENLEKSNITESEQSNCGEHNNFFVQTERIESGPKCSLNNMNLNECGIMDFSIIEQPLLQTSELKNYENITSAESEYNVSNLIEISIVSTANMNSVEQKVVVSSENPVVNMTSETKSEESTSLHETKFLTDMQLNSIEQKVVVSSENPVVNMTSETKSEESTSLHETKFLTDMQLNDESLLMESPDKSSIAESFHSIESEHVQEDNKRKIEAIQEYQSKEKKIKVMDEEPRTPMSMLYKIKSMFQSSEKRPLHSINKNYLKLNKSHQNLNLCKYEENKDNFTKPTSLKKSEVLVKSKIPCKVNDKSMLKNVELNNSSSLNTSIKTIPKRVPLVSTDVSNSSNKICPKSHIPSKFKK